MDMNVLYPIKERSIRLIQKDLFVYPAAALIIIYERGSGHRSLWSDYYLNHLEVSKNYHDYYELIDSLVGFIKIIIPGFRKRI